MRDYYSSKRRTHIYILPGSGYIPDIDLVSNLHIQPFFYIQPSATVTKWCPTERGMWTLTNFLDMRPYRCTYCARSYKSRQSMKEHEYQCPYKSDPVQPNSGKYSFLTTSSYNQATGSRTYTDGTNQNLKFPLSGEIRIFEMHYRIFWTTSGYNDMTGSSSNTVGTNIKSNPNP